MKYIIATAALVAAAFAAPAWSAPSYVLQINGIKGGSALDTYENWIDVSSWAWGVSNVGASPGSGTSRPNSGKPVFDEFKWTQGIDSSVVPIFGALTDGKERNKAELDVLRPVSGKPTAYFQLIFSNVRMVSQHFTGADGGAPEMAGALNFEKVEMRYRPQDDKGKLGGWISGAFDLQKGTPTFSGDPGVMFGLLSTGGEVNFVATSAALVPEPQTWALMIAGLALTGFVARRRRSA